MKLKLELIKYEGRIGLIHSEDDEAYSHLIQSHKDVKTTLEHKTKYGGVYEIHFLDNNEASYKAKNNKKIEIIPYNSKEYKQIMIKYFGAWEEEFEDNISLLANKDNPNSNRDFAENYPDWREFMLINKCFDDIVSECFEDNDKVKIQCRKGEIRITKI